MFTFLMNCYFFVCCFNYLQSDLGNDCCKLNKCVNDSTFSWFPNLLNRFKEQLL